jgi:hypothetical protein
MKKIILYIAVSAISTAAMAQGTVEVLRFSQVYHSGTARFSAMGGAFTALGSDPSALAYNPGGLGVYRRSEFAFTPHLLGAYNTASMDNSPFTDSKFKFGLSNMAGIFAFDISGSSLKYLNFGFSYNKSNHYSDASMVRGMSRLYGNTGNNTMSDYFAQIANGVNKYPDDLTRNDGEAYLGWNGGAIDFDTAGGRNEYVAPYKSDEQIQNEQRSFSSGMMGEYDFSIGGNISDIFYFGMTIGVVSIRYEENRTLSETSNTTGRNDYTQKFNMDGSGFNFKFGFILTPFVNADFATGLRIGAAWHTPTFLEMTDSYYASMTWKHSNGSSMADLPDNEFRYLIETPFRYMLGLAYVFPGDKLRGIISADYEYVDYSSARMREHRDYINDGISGINDVVAADFRDASNIRVGGELGYKHYSFRAGYSYYGNAYQSTVRKNSAVNMFSLGIGIRYFRNSYIDFAYTRAMQNDKGYLFHTENGAGRVVSSPEVKYDIVQNNFMITLGWRF